MSLGQVAIFLGIIITALILDFWLIQLWRKRREQGAKSKNQVQNRSGWNQFRQLIRTLQNEWTIFTHPSHWKLSLSQWFFLVAIGLYLLTRFIGLDKFPVAFHADEAYHTILASELVQNDGYYENTFFFPTYFKNFDKFNLSFSVYLQLIPYLMFGKSILVTRGTSILVTLIAAIAVGLIIRDILKFPFPWVAPFVLSTTPVWFLFSRTAFETVLATSFYAGFLYSYMRYRMEQIRFLYPALIFGALTFYSYSPAQLTILATCTVLLLIDFPYHLKYWRTGIRGLGLVIILILPYIRFRLAVPDAVDVHLRGLSSYWLQSRPFSEKVSLFWHEYLFGINPVYWFFSSRYDAPRYLMGFHSHISPITFPFALIGFFTALRQYKQPAYRVILIALFVTPLAGTLASVTITRVLAFVIPIVILTSIGLIITLNKLTNWGKSRDAIPVVVLAGFCMILGWSTFDAVKNGPLWDQNYGMSGLNYGAEQIYAEINHILEVNPDQHIVISPDWAINTEMFPRFFLKPPYHIQLASVYAYYYSKRELNRETLLVIPVEEYQLAQQSPKFQHLSVDKILNYPTGQPGFYFVRMEYAENIDEIFSQELIERHIMVEKKIVVDGRVVSVSYSKTDVGEIENLFDGNPETLVRGAESNPFIVELTFPTSLPINGLTINTGVENIEIRTSVYVEANPLPFEYTFHVDGSEYPYEKVINFGQTIDTQFIRVEIELLEIGEPAHVHIWEITLHK